METEPQYECRLDDDDFEWSPVRRGLKGRFAVESYLTGIGASEFSDNDCFDVFLREQGKPETERTFNVEVVFVPAFTVEAAQAPSAGTSGSATEEQHG